MSPRDKWSSDAWNASRRSRSAIRHDDGPIPDAARIAAERHELSRWLAWAAIALMVITFGRHFV
jgi:hypothetical protein